MVITLTPEEIKKGLEIQVTGYRGDSGKHPTQILLEHYKGKLLVHVWNGESFDPVTTEIKRV